MTETDNLRLELMDSKTFCFYPYLELSTNPSGHFKPCCYYDNVMPRSDGKPYSVLNGDTFDNTWNSQPMIDVRKQLYEGTIPNECKKCIREGDASMRARSVKEYRNDYKTIELVRKTIANDYVAEHTPTILELKPSSLCNLKCVMCNSYDSTQVAKELKELANKFGGIKINNGRFIEISLVPGISEDNHYNAEVTQPEWSDNEIIWENFTRLAPNLEVLSFAGGEPTIMPFVLKALKYCADNGYSKNITVFVSSNFTNLNKHFFEIMTKFKKFELIASIDGFGKVNDYARYPSKWSQISTNYIEAKKYMDFPNVKIMTNITVSLLNIMNLTDLLYWLEERAVEYPYFKEWPFNINMILYPADQQISILPQHLKDIAKERLQTYLKTSKILQDNPGLDSKIYMLLNELDKPENPQLVQAFKNRIKVLDEHREINIIDYIPELKEVFSE